MPRTEADDRPATARTARGRRSSPVAECGTRPYVEERRRRDADDRHRRRRRTVTPQRRTTAATRSTSATCSPASRCSGSTRAGASSSRTPRSTRPSAGAGIAQQLVAGAMADVAAPRRDGHPALPCRVRATCARTRCPGLDIVWPHAPAPRVRAAAMTRLDTDDAVATEALGRVRRPARAAARVARGAARRRPRDGGAPRRFRSATCRSSAPGASSTASGRR